ncbi:GHKL domain-containing protein [Pseudomonas syringae]|uniref:sensor histidine kinase n=1 Tax=Pseudomonas syringae TaxID=317 RepID=UPI001F1D5449|nr:HAMP domain-containing sensor histidine kinase [Pseudomonas syringae]MCF5710174.1 GHKL domain-containing protein [Pseudomonas syringae]
MKEAQLYAPPQKTARPDRDFVANRVKDLRERGEVDGAISVCLEHLAIDPENKTLRNILSDMYVRTGRSPEAADVLLDNMQYMSGYYRDIKSFVSRYYRLKRVLSESELEGFSQALEKNLNLPVMRESFSAQIKKILFKNIQPQEDVVNPEIVELTRLASDDSNFNEFVRKEKELEAGSPDQFVYMLDFIILNRARSSSTWRIDLYCVSLYEKSNSLDKALKVVDELLSLRIDFVAVRSLLRICRQQNDYTYADILFEREPGLLRTKDFNVMYELVYYFEYQEDFHSALGVLQMIAKRFATNLPVLRTVRNFYIRLGMIEEAGSLAQTIAVLYSRKHDANQKYITEVTESETAVASKLQELYSQLEHQKQLAAISDLTTGISHELGQPLTNIRYTIQFYRRKLEKNLSLDVVTTVFSSILEETERMGGLVRRLSPLTSSKAVKEPFDIMSRIQKRVDGERPRLIESGIRVSIKPIKPILLTGDPVKFDQLVSNLLLNAIDAINERGQKSKKEIAVSVALNSQEILLSFSDTGVGIPAANRHKIFDPFFSTKAAGQGEGLGLFIVWNLLKMLGGKISVDTQYKDGAKFLISLPNASGTKE